MYEPSSRTYNPSLKAGIKTIGKTKFKMNLSDLLDFQIHWSIQLWTGKETLPMSTSLL